jgi:hypothetical protein
VVVGVVGGRGALCGLDLMFHFVEGLTMDTARYFRHAESPTCCERDRGDNPIVAGFASLSNVPRPVLVRRVKKYVWAFLLAMSIAVRPEREPPCSSPSLLWSSV